MIIGNKKFDFDKRTYIMGILNVTPDSFSDGGKYLSRDSMVQHTLKMIEDGADIIDIGGMSTRPGHIEISEEEEVERVVQAVEYIRAETDIPLSIDTYRGEVARESIKRGANLINDVWGLKADASIADIISEYKVPSCLMHNREAIFESDNAEEFLEAVKNDLEETLAIADKAGINRDTIILDPGIGFGKNLKQNLIVLNKLEYFNKMGYPMLLGCSRKSVIGKTLNLPENEREEGTLVTSVLAAKASYGFVRVHDVKTNKRALDMLKAISDSCN